MAHVSFDIISLAAAILREEGARDVYVFGSHAKGTAGPRSDLDFAVVGLPADRTLRAMARVTKATGLMVDLIDADRESAFIAYLRSKGELRRVA